MVETNIQTCDILGRTAFIASAAAVLLTGLALAFRSELDSELGAAVMARRGE